MDPFFWMRDRLNPKVIEHLKRENRHTERMMNHTLALQEELYRELRGRIPENDCSAPYRRGAHWYYYRSEAGRQYEIYCRAKGGPDGPDGPEEILLDLNEVARGHEYCDLGAFVVSPDGGMLAYTIDTAGQERYLLRFRNLDTGEDIAEAIENVGTRVCWANDSLTAFYCTLDESVRPSRLHRHHLGTSPARDVMVYEETDPAYRVMVTKSRSGRFILARLESQVTTEARVLEADRPEGEFRLVQERREGVEYYLLHRGERFYILTNDEAINFRIMTAPVADPGRDHWEEFIEQMDGVMIEDAEIFINHMVLFERIQGMNAIRIIDLCTEESHEIAFDEVQFVCWSGRNPLFDTTVFRFAYSSLIVPRSVIAYDMVTRERRVLKIEAVVGGYDPSDYRTERIHAVSKDGTMVPVSLVYRRGLVRDKTNPILLYGYGAYGESSEPEFYSERLSLLDRGFVFAIAHVRGGSELGREWYEGGKLLAKKNTFFDFIACAEHLIAEGYTSPERLVIEGTSAGGLLVGTVVNMRPDLFQAAIADVPFVDVVNTMLDESIPRTAMEFDEWGDPLDDEEVRKYLKSYSPYDNVKPREYPNLLITAGLNDPRVHFSEPAKWVAKLRSLKTDDNLLLLRTDFRGGHFGPTGRYDYLKEFAFKLAFIFDVLEIESTKGPAKDE